MGKLYFYLLNLKLHKKYLELSWQYVMGGEIDNEKWKIYRRNAD